MMVSMKYTAYTHHPGRSNSDSIELEMTFVVRLCISHKNHPSIHHAIFHQPLNNQTLLFLFFYLRHYAYDTSIDKSSACP